MSFPCCICLLTSAFLFPLDIKYSTLHCKQSIKQAIPRAASNKQETGLGSPLWCSGAGAAVTTRLAIRGIGSTGAFESPAVQGTKVCLRLIKGSSSSVSLAVKWELIAL